MAARAPAAPRSRSGSARRPRWQALRIFLAAALALAALLLPSSRALAAFTPPPLRGHVVDTAGKLSDSEVRQLDARLDAVRQQTGFAVVAFVVGSLEGEPIEDVAYRTFNAWTVGEKGRDDGVLLVIAPAERRVRIETGKGVGGALTDLQSNDIIRQKIAPLLQQGRFYEAVDQGTTAIADALVKGTPDAGGKRPAPAARLPDLVKVGLYAGLLLLVMLLAIVSPRFRSVLWVIVQMFFWSGGRGGGGAGGGSGYQGGGGRSGGGGSSDSY